MNQVLAKIKNGGKKAAGHVKKQAKFYGGAVLGAAAVLGAQHLNKK